MHTTFNVHASIAEDHVLDDMAVNEPEFRHAFVFTDRFSDGQLKPSSACLIVSDYTPDHYDMLSPYLEQHPFTHVECYVRTNKVDGKGRAVLNKDLMTLDAFRHIFNDARLDGTLATISNRRTTAHQRQSDMYLAATLSGKTVYALTTPTGTVLYFGANDEERLFEEVKRQVSDGVTLGRLQLLRIEEVADNCLHIESLHIEPVTTYAIRVV